MWKCLVGARDCEVSTMVIPEPLSAGDGGVLHEVFEGCVLVMCEVSSVLMWV